jgi:hypothetical protein
MSENILKEPVMNEKVAKVEKLTDLVEWETEAMDLLESLVARLRSQIGQDAIAMSLRNNKPRITKGTILSVLHQTKPITYFVEDKD